MIDILNFIIKHCYKLFNPYRFKFIDSEAAESSGHGAWVLLDSQDVQFYFSLEKGELLLWLGSKYDDRQNKWYSFDVVRSVLTNEPLSIAIMDAENGKYLENNISGILGLFEKTKYENTLVLLDQAEKLRDIRLWGE